MTIVKVPISVLFEINNKNDLAEDKILCLLFET